MTVKMNASIRVFLHDFVRARNPGQPKDSRFDEIYAQDFQKLWLSATRGQRLSIHELRRALDKLD